MIFHLLEDSLGFPNPALAEEDGLLAIGGDLSTARLILAYQNGIFPWFSEGDPILWFSPEKRCVLFPGEIHISKSMRRVFNSGKFSITKDKAFDEVVVNCATINRKGQDGTWITDEMQAAYKALNKLGYAKSIEIWDSDKLVGGIYGVVINNVFCGESMFSRCANASKAALIYLCTQGGYKLIDCQIPNEHLMSLGAKMIDRNEFLNLLP